MKIIQTIERYKAYVEEIGADNIGFVPTMGALHEGHISLVERARKECSVVVVSIFVNPTQFNDKKDLERYPRTPLKDMDMLKKAGTDILFLPNEKEIYPEPDTRVFDFGLLDQVMEGATRPGHFNGVGQVVSRLFDIVQPQKAYFGEKDFQQVAVVKRMVGMLGYNVQIVPCAIVREKDGLAMSSRNVLLDAQHRKGAPHIYKTIQRAAAMRGSLSPRQLEEWVAAELAREGTLEPIYAAVVNAKTLLPLPAWGDSEARLCVAVWSGAVRLIDNIAI